jgi:hypothetical protein
MPAFYTHWQLIMYRDGCRAIRRCRSRGQLTAPTWPTCPRTAWRSARWPGAIDAARAAAGAGPSTARRATDRLLGQQQVPRLAGQDFDYLLKRLRGYQAKTTSDLDGMMTMVAQPLTDADVENLTHFMASLGPEP